MSAPRVASGSLMVCGTASNSGKSLLVAGLCRLLARQGVKVAPFKGQNMALNSLVTADGDEIGRAQGAQAAAASVEPEAAMNPVLLKPTSDRRSQVIVMGRPWRTLDAADFYAAKAELVSIVDQALDDLRHRFDVVICEGAGSPAEINLLAHDLVNLGLAGRAKVPAILVGDIDRGGVFAHLYGTTALLPDDDFRSYEIRASREIEADHRDAARVRGDITLGGAEQRLDVSIQGGRFRAIRFQHRGQPGGRKDDRGCARQAGAEQLAPRHRYFVVRIQQGLARSV